MTEYKHHAENSTQQVIQSAEPYDLEFVTPKSFVDSSFFQKLGSLKLDSYKLDNSAKDIYGYYNFRSIVNNSVPSIALNDLCFEDSNELENSLPAGYNLIVKGSLFNVNTIEEFKKIDKATFLREAGSRMYDKIRSGEAFKNPQALMEFNLLTFADLKKFKFYYWFAFPKLTIDWVVISKTVFASDSRINYLETWLKENPKEQAFLLSGDDIHSLSDIDLLEEGAAWTLGFIDTGTTKANVPSYQLQNVLAALAIKGVRKVTVDVFRFNHSADSFSMELSLKSKEDLPETCPRVTGWERTGQNKLGPKLANLGSLINPEQLADQAIDLNLKLMKWRVSPNLDLDTIKATKCLLLGSGTLGSYVGRALLGWGVRNITFVDNGKVSFSNPVRQPLFKFDDCLDGGAPKAVAAAAAMKEIFPLCNAVGYQLEVPMAGHPVTNEESQKKQFEQLAELIERHDAIFLLMDSRETRWLPTIIGNSKHKIVINAALGFDSYLVMRHGCLRPETDLTAEDQGDRLGCYFCNDVVAPSDSTTDRSLDQMCTVTRPGVALIASALAVELLVSILQNPERQYADANDSKNATILGELPHQMRGFLHKFETVKVQATNYKYCSGCSLKVLKEYEDEGWEFVKKALESSKYIEDLTGLTQVHEEAELAAEGLELIDSEDEWE
ncbi:unnamed protein product [Kuraishia capsulata CBS 1993]|uniref:Ubiquitin-like modifier-activating enzyme ATG7 n=1 Tax=Kuraishia capsulata CBS 1993 TaxID=1382522 RepID=W6MM05_9ASCO|nr:uncharacterized protein KUCA_T00003537001 [Kuraishia capsulata CBS 1993]CDK27559.1 unnamed protein product [Kuraishia capsulata CBS 1993]